MELYLVRHTSVDVPPGICYGNSDVDVRETFIEEASQTKKSLEKIQFDEVFTSPLRRARKLALFCGYTDAKIDNRLIEYNFGDWEMKSYDKLYAENTLFRKWINDYTNLRCPNGDSLQDQVLRVNSFLASVKKRNYKCICVFCHGGVIAICNSICNEKNLKDCFSDIPPYGSVQHYSL